MKKPRLRDYGLSKKDVERIEEAILRAKAKNERWKSLIVKYLTIAAGILCGILGFTLFMQMPSGSTRSDYISLPVRLLLSLSLGGYGFGMIGAVIIKGATLAIFWLFKNQLARLADTHLRAIDGFDELHAYKFHLSTYDQEVRLLKEEEERLRKSREEAERCRQEQKRRSRLLKEKKFWRAQDGYTFERNMAAIFRMFGHKVRRTSGSGDEGVDLFLDNDTIVQCKATKSQIPPAVVRDLYGTMKHFGSIRGIIISLGGFTPGCHQFIKGKNIELWDLDRLLEKTRGLSPNKRMIIDV